MSLALILTTALLTASNNVDGARILGVFPHTGRSHQMVFEPYLQKLAERGHEVTVVSFFPRKVHIENYTDISLEGLAPLGVEVLDMSLFEHGSVMNTIGLGGVEKFFIQVMEFGFLAKSALHVCSKIVDYPPLEKTLKKEYDLIIVENFNSDCVFGLLHAHEVKAPVIGLLSSSVMPWTCERMGLFENPAYVPVVSSSFAASMNYMERVKNTFLSVFYKLWYRYAIQVKEQALLEMRFGKIPDLQDLGSKFSMMLVNTFHSLNGVRPLLPGIVEVGGMHLSPKTEILPKFIEKFLNESEHGVVVVSFGSLLKTSTLPKYREELFINALSKLKQRVIWKFETSDEEGTQIGNILRVKWLPQYQLIQHNKVLAFVAHGGLLGMTEAISAGKPMLVIPFFGDQPHNGRVATEAGLATVLPYDEMNEKTFFEALQKILSAEMRVKARLASKIWLDRPAPPMDTAVYWTERVIRWGANAPLHSAARDLNIFQIALLDVLAAFIFIVFSILFVVKLFLLVIKRIFSSKKLKVH